MSDNVPSLPLLAVRSLVVLPAATVSVPVGRTRSLRLVEEIGAGGGVLLVAVQKDPDIEEPTLRDLYPVCVESQVVRITRPADGPLTLVLRGIARRRIATVVRYTPFPVATYDSVSEILGNAAAAETLRTDVLAAVQQLVAAKDVSQAVADAIHQNQDAEMSDVATSLLSLEPEHHISVLCALEIATIRYKLLLGLEERLSLLGGSAA
jgi:ATP-dependent Lon protease